MINLIVYEHYFHTFNTFFNNEYVWIFFLRSVVFIWKYIDQKVSQDVQILNMFANEGYAPFLINDSFAYFCNHP